MIEHILIVDDDRAWIRPFLYVLESSFPNYNIWYVQNTQTALKVLSENKVRLIISDNMFIGDGEYEGGFNNGIEFYKQIRKDGNMIPFIMMTNSPRRSFVSENTRLFEDGNLYFIEKPSILPNDLITYIEKFLK